MSPSNVQPVRHHVIVNVPVRRAFDLFTTKFDAIKPREHNLLPVEIAETVFDPYVGGHISDIGVDGSRCQWARVVVFEPPSRVVFTWDISPSWQIEHDLSKCSEVEVRFIAESGERTRVELEHRHLERHGEAWRSVVDGVDGEAGWPLYLARYAEQVESAVAS